MKVKQIISIIGCAVLVAGAAVGDTICVKNAPMITNFFNGTGQNFDTKEFQQAAEQSDALCEDIAAKGIVLLKNKDNTLPLKGEKKINLFGWHSSDAGFNLSGIGSGSSTIQDDKKVTLVDAFKNAGWSVNENLVKFYQDYDNTARGYGTGNGDRIPLVEPSVSSYTDTLISDALSFSDNAVMVISRIGGENVGEIPLLQTKSHGQASDSTRNYLQLSTEEDDLLDLLEENFRNVIVVINSTNQLQSPRLKRDPKIGAVLNVAIPGQSGARAIPKILSGDITPSGRLSDTWANDYTKDPSFANYIRQGDNIFYGEDIYFGYKWYETADAEGYFDSMTYSDDYAEDATGYDAVVTYPFGYGLSYTTFEWEITDVTLKGGESLTATSRVDITLACTNTGSVKGADAIELFGSAPYTVGGIEKSSEVLLDFAKSALLEPGQTQTDIIVSFSSYDLASYDCYDKNGNGFAGYELDPGTYKIQLKENAHQIKNMVGEKDEDNATLTYTIPKEGIRFEKDPLTGEDVVNRVTGEDAYSGVPLDGSTVYGDKASYLSRSDLEGTFPTKLTSGDVTKSEVSKANSYVYHGDDQTEMPTFDQDNGLSLYTDSSGNKPSASALASNSGLVANDELLQKIGKEDGYDSDTMNDLLDQMSASDVKSIVENGGFGTPAIASIGKPKTYDYDGPAGFNTTTQTDKAGQWTAFPNETLLAQTFDKDEAKAMGLSIGTEGVATGLSGWYAPGCNLHRSPFNGRNYEYYSEDPILSGLLASKVIEGAKSYGIVAYVKHFTLSEPGVNARNLNTWLTEQNWRENYLKPFEFAVKKGKAIGIMSAFNSVGGVWAGAHHAQNIDILRNEWGFKGTMITDWSRGDGNMNTTSGLPGGNDIWLNPGNHASPLSTSNATQMYLAKRSARNVIYAYASAYTFAKNYDHKNDAVKVNIGDKVETTNGFAWWTLLLGAVNVLLIGGGALWVILSFRKPKEKKNSAKKAE